MEIVMPAKSNVVALTAIQNAPAPARAKAKKGKAERIVVAGLAEYTDFAVLERAMKEEKAGSYDELRENVISQFIQLGAAEKVRPANFTGIEGLARASCELKDRSSASPITNEEAALLDKHGIPTETVGTAATYAINPAYVGNAELLEKVSKALSKIEGMPADFLLPQASTQKVVVGEGAIDKLFEKKPAVIRELIDIVAQIAIRDAKIDDAKIAYENVKNRFN
jgi:hypothetical protein